MGVGLYFPDGVPDNVQRIVDPDAIHKKVATGLKDLESQWKKLAGPADAVVQGKRPWWKRLFGGSLKTAHKYVINGLYAPVSQWPSGLNKEEKAALRLVRRLRQYGPSPLVPMTNQDAVDAPSEDEMREAFKMLAKDAIPIARKAEDAFHKMLDTVGKIIEPLCQEIYDEPCVRGEGAEIALADIRALVKMDRFRGISPPGVRVLRDFWDIAYGSR